MSVSMVISFAALLASIGTVLWVFRAIKNRRSFTREEFAFRAMTSYLAFCVTIASSLVGKEGFISKIIRVIRGTPQSAAAANPLEHVVLLLLAAIPAVLIYKFYANWAGAISVDEHRREQTQTRPALVRDALSEASRVLHRRKREIHRSAANQPMFSPLPIPVDTLAWRLQALDLITLRHPSYQFDVNHDWHPEAVCWIGELPNTNQVVVVLCMNEDPPDAQVAAALEYLHRVFDRTLEPREVILWVAIKEGQINTEINIGGFTVNKSSEAAILDDLVDFTYYFKHLRRRVEQDKLADSSRTLADVYAPSRCVSEHNTVHDNVETYLQAWAAEHGQRQLALLGEYGQGKSTTALMFAYRLITESKGKPQRVPILIELRGKSPRNSSPEELIAGWAFHHDHIVPKAVMKLIIAGHAIVILEGFDEMALAGDSYARYAHFRTLWQFCYPKSKLLFTGRPNYFLDDRELKSSLAISEPTATGPYCEAVRLEPFGTDQMALALRSYADKTRSEILGLAKANPRFNEVVSRGSLLYVVGELWDRGLAAQGANINSAIVMGRFIQSTYARQAAKADQNKDFIVLNSGERAYFMSALAYHMCVNRLPNQIDAEHFRRVVERVFNTIPDEVSGHVTALANEPRVPLRERLRSADDPIESVATDVRACAVLVSDGSKMGALKFAHKSFMEYLAAEVLVTFTLSGIHGWTTEVLASVVVDPDGAADRNTILLGSPEVLLFFAELLINDRRFRRLEGDDLRHAFFTIIIDRTRTSIVKRFFEAYVLAVFLVTPGTEDYNNILPVMRPAIVYFACCAIAGVTVPLSSHAFGRKGQRIAGRWIGRNLPHLIPHNGSPAEAWIR